MLALYWPRMAPTAARQRMHDRERAVLSHFDCGPSIKKCMIGIRTDRPDAVYYL